MQRRDRVWLWFSAAVSIVAGFALVFNNSGAGWFLIVLGSIYIGASGRAAQGSAASNTRWIWWGLVGVTLLSVGLVIVGCAAFLLK